MDSNSTNPAPGGWSSTAEQVAPVLEALKAGIPVFKVKPGETWPIFPAVPMMLLIDDAPGAGPSAFDSTKLFDQINSVIIVVPIAIGEGAAALAARARAGDRSLLVQAPVTALAQWLALVSERRKLAHHFLCLVAGDVPNDVRLMLNDIDAIASEAVN